MSPIIHLNYNVNKEHLLKEANIVKCLSTGYTDSRYPYLNLEDWKIYHYNSDYIQEIIDNFKVKGNPRFYWLSPNAIIPEHIDNGTKCSINIILTENAAPITINGIDYEYHMILLNTQIPHSVKNNNVERIMLKISIFNETFDNLANRIRYKI